MDHTPTKSTITLRFTGEVTIDSEPLIQFLRWYQLEPVEHFRSTPMQSSNAVAQEKSLSKLAYSMRETADLLSVSYVTVHRLLKRGLLKSSGALRHKIIPRSEIERFLKETTSSL